MNLLACSDEITLEAELRCTKGELRGRDVELFKSIRGFVTGPL
ncbi:MAG TPA: hypothetical protein PLQ43_02810 [Deltaproteobacteria bacterium]|nr:hypothetical protein [Deltaproteobacteria bacterium]